MPAPGALGELERVVGDFASSGGLQTFYRFLLRTGGGGVTNPETDGEWCHALRQWICFSEVFHGAHEGRSALELLCRKQTQGVSGDDRRTTASNPMLKTTPEDLEGRQPEVGFGLTSTGGEPDQVH